MKALKLSFFPIETDLGVVVIPSLAALHITSLGPL